jgi:phage terminase large subunit
MPGMIEHMQHLGYKIIAAKKGPGSVETGIKYLRGFREIVVHPTCVHTADELKRYSRKTDPRTGDILPIIKPGHDHLMDALRYATEPLWSQAPLWCYVDHVPQFSARELGL